MFRVLSGERYMKDQWIQNLVDGKTFADIGGLWGTVNEKVSVAVEAGASAAAMVDIQDITNDLWKNFDDRCNTLGVSGYVKIQADIMESTAAGLIGTHDIVHCSGIIYHTPEPLRLLHNLKKVTGTYLILGSTTIPSSIRVRDEVIETIAGTSYFVPALSNEQNQLFAEHFNHEGIQIMGINWDHPFDWYNANGGVNFSPWWWLFTSEYLVSLLELAGFEVIDVTETWPNKAHAFLCKPKA